MSIYEKILKAREQLWKMSGMSFVQRQELVGMLSQIMILAFENNEKIPKSFFLTTPNKMNMEVVRKFLEENLELQIQEMKWVYMGKYACSYFKVKLI